MPNRPANEKRPPTYSRVVIEDMLTSDKARLVKEAQRRKLTLREYLLYLHNKETATLDAPKSGKSQTL